MISFSYKIQHICKSIIGLHHVVNWGRPNAQFPSQVITILLPAQVSHGRTAPWGLKSHPAVAPAKPGEVHGPDGSCPSGKIGKVDRGGVSQKGRSQPETFFTERGFFVSRMIFQGYKKELILITGRWGIIQCEKGTFHSYHGDRMGTWMECWYRVTVLSWKTVQEIPPFWWG